MNQLNPHEEELLKRCVGGALSGDGSELADALADLMFELSENLLSGLMMAVQVTCEQYKDELYNPSTELVGSGDLALRALEALELVGEGLQPQAALGAVMIMQSARGQGEDWLGQLGVRRGAILLVLELAGLLRLVRAGGELEILQQVLACVDAA